MSSEAVRDAGRPALTAARAHALKASAMILAACLLTACASREPTVLWSTTSSPLELLLHRLKEFNGRAACEAALAEEVAKSHASVDAGRASAGSRWEKLPRGRREVGPRGEQVTTTFACMDGDRRPGEIR